VIQRISSKRDFAIVHNFVDHDIWFYVSAGLNLYARLKKQVSFL
jgi:hypothetical protein